MLNYRNALEIKLPSNFKGEKPSEGNEDAHTYNPTVI